MARIVAADEELIIFRRITPTLRAADFEVVLAGGLV